MQTLVTTEGYRNGGEPRPCHVGQLVMRVNWADGRVTETICRNYNSAYDVIGGNAYPYMCWEILGVPEVRQTLARWATKHNKR